MAELARLMCCPTRPIAMPAGPDEVLFLEGDPCEYVYEVRRGVVRAVKFSAEGQRQIAAIFFPGDHFGLPYAKDYRFTAEAVTETLIVKYDRHNWLQSFIVNPADPDNIPEPAANEPDAIFLRGCIVGKHGVLVRLSSFLLVVEERLEPDGNGGRLLPLPQTDIADFLATSPESVCRALRQLREMRLISMSRRDRFVIIDKARLSAISEC